MSDLLSQPTTAFIGNQRFASGSLLDVALGIKAAQENGTSGTILAFDDATGRVVDLDLRGTREDIVARLSPPASGRVGSPPTSTVPKVPPRRPGRPSLGVLGREVTLLPRHWEWLAAQPGGASVALRKLVEDARRTGGAKQRARQAQEAAYSFMLAMAGDFPGYEEALRALFANDRERFNQHIADWPVDVRTHASALAFGRQTEGSTSDTPPPAET